MAAQDEAGWPDAAEPSLDRFFRRKNSSPRGYVIQKIIEIAASWATVASEYLAFGEGKGLWETFDPLQMRF
jgi:hypothetical protein